MTAWPQQRRCGGLVAAVAARAEAWLLDPAAPRPARVESRLPPRPIVAVVGLGGGCGTTTVARALAAELARRDPADAAVVTAASVPPAAAAIATAGARRLARALGARAVGRLALLDAGDPAVLRVTAERSAPAVLDVGHGTPPEAALALCDQALLVASPAVEPALAEVAAQALRARPLVVLNRAFDVAGWRRPPDALVPDSRLAAKLVLAGRDPIGPLAAALREIADTCVAAAADA